jgi:glutathione S-transferase
MSPTSSPPARVVYLAPSTDAEVARWALAYYGVPADARAHAPLFHVLAEWRVAHAEMPLRKMSTVRPPSIVLVNEAGILINAQPIVEYLESLPSTRPRLVPAALAAHADGWWTVYRHQLGLSALNWAYFNLLPSRALSLPSLTSGVPAAERLAWAVGYGGLRRLLWSSLRLDAPRVVEDADRAIRDVFVSINTRLADGRRFLNGDQITLEDLLFAAMAAPVVAPPEYSVPLPRVSALPPAMRVLADWALAQPAGQFVLRMYREHRHAS